MLPVNLLLVFLFTLPSCSPFSSRIRWHWRIWIDLSLGWIRLPLLGMDICRGITEALAITGRLGRSLLRKEYTTSA
ncbi:hypothetical protein F4802DRAFT_561138 [Xylaria palmicola]|nr:hypothetical protein F4802DRAFT_561138 [Xylaria palmicola]